MSRTLAACLRQAKDRTKQRQREADAHSNADHQVILPPRGPLVSGIPARSHPYGSRILIIGFVIAAASGALGIAGGEMRIPAALAFGELAPY